MVHVAYEVVDVFTTVRFGGNPLAVIPDARGLDDTLMQQIAAEFGFSETSFVLPSADPQNTARVRIFTPTTEVPFAGHPNVGTAFVLAQRDAIFGQTVGEQMRFEELAGLVDVTVLRSEFLVPAEGLNKVTGKPFLIAELEAAIRARLEA